MTPYLLGVFLCCCILPAFSQDIYGEPLFLTPYIQDGRIEEGQAAAKVEGLSSTIESYSGYITTNEEYNSNLFFWFFPARYNAPNAPILLWLNGGPGSSSMFGLFSENGPFYVDSHYRLNVKEINWATEFSVLYVDQPAGTGFSFTENLAGFARNQTDVGEAFYVFLVQWFQLFSQYQTNEFYITGESFAGLLSLIYIVRMGYSGTWVTISECVTGTLIVDPRHYIPAISYQIYLNNPTADLQINFKGFAIGDGWIDPINQLDYGTFLYYVGLIGEAELQVFYEIQDEMAVLINNGEYAKASYLLQQYGWDTRKSDSKRNVGNYMWDSTGISFVYNYLYSIGPSDQNYYTTFLEFPWVRKAIHVGNLTFDDENGIVYALLFADITKTVRPWLEELLNSTQYKIMLYNGQVDIICAHSLTTNMISHLDWYGAEDFANAERNVWRVHDVQVAGYSRTAHNFTQIIIRNAGHYVPYDQPLWAQDMITRFVKGEDF